MRNVSVALRNYLSLESEVRMDESRTRPGFSLYPEDSPESDRILEQMNFVPKMLKKGTVLIYLPNSFSSWGVKPGRDEFLVADCPVKNCALTASKSDAAQADAIVFRQHINMDVNQPFTRRPEQIW